MRKKFSSILHDKMGSDDRLFLLTGDLGYGLWDKIKIDFPDRFQDFGSSEQLMVAAACGLGTDGYIPLVYSITPFVLYRPFEFIRNYVNHEEIPVKLLGGGRDRDYGYLGFSHWAEDDKKIMKTFDKINSYWPEDETELNNVVDNFLFNGKPSYLNLRR
jgi:transketolase